MKDNTVLWALVVLGVIGVLSGVHSEFNFDHTVHPPRTTIKTFENDTVLLPCRNSESTTYIRWHRNNTVFADSRHPESPTPERIHLWPNGSLQVSNVQEEDAGYYSCELVSPRSTGLQTHAIEVQYPPSVISEPSGFLELPIGSVFEMACEAKGIPVPLISWRHNGVSTDSYRVGNRQSHVVEVKSRDMSGPIECLAMNGVGEPATAGVLLSVLFSPEVVAIHSVVHTTPLMRAHLECLVKAAPAATVHWFFHGIPVPADSRFARHDNELESNSSHSHYYTESKHILIVKRVKDSDLGVYECRAENKIGFRGVAIELTARPLPCVFKINPTIQSPTEHNLIWQTESQTPLSEFKLKFRQIPSGNVTPQNRVLSYDWTELTVPSEISGGPIHTKSYNLRGLQPASLYEVLVIARNRFGWSDNSKTVRFATGGEVELPNYSTESDIQYDEEVEEDILNEITQSSHTYSASTTSRGTTAIYSNASRTSLFIFLNALILGVPLVQRLYIHFSTK